MISEHQKKWEDEWNRYANAERNDESLDWRSWIGDEPSKTKALLKFSLLMHKIEPDNPAWNHVLLMPQLPIAACECGGIE